MPFVHGKNSVVWVYDAAGTCRNLSGDKNSVTMSWSRNNPETTTFGHNAVTRIAGIQDLTLTGTGMFNTDDASGIDTVLACLMVGSMNADVIYCPAGSISGCPIYAACYLISKYDIVGPVAGVVGVNWEFQMAAGSMAVASCL